MSERFATAYRTHLAGSLRSYHADNRVRLVGWVHRRRDLGGLVFIDLRDRAGIVQVSVDPEFASADVVKTARGLGPEDVIQIEGTVNLRPGGKVNPELQTGEIEVRAEKLTIIQAADPLPIPVYRAPD